MKAAPFAYTRPERLEDALTALAQERSVALAGGQSLMPALNFRERRAGLLVDLARVPELRGISADGVVRIGAMEPMWDVERADAVAAHAPLLPRALATVGAPAIRARATLGGSAAWADPTSQLPATLLALDATLVTSTGRRRAEEFFAASGGTSLAAGELILAVEVPPAGAAGVGLHHVRRSAITWPVAGCAAIVRVEGGVVRSARIALYGAGRGPVLARAAASALEGRAPEPDVLRAAGRAAVEGVEAVDDARASGAYRVAVLPALVRRALSDAARAA